MYSKKNINKFEFRKNGRIATVSKGRSTRDNLKGVTTQAPVDQAI